MLFRSEAFEEVGVKVTNLRYFSSQGWPFPNSLMIAYVADYVSGEIVPQEGEIEEAAWFTLDALPQLPHRLSLEAAAERVDADRRPHRHRARAAGGRGLRRGDAA